MTNVKEVNILNVLATDPIDLATWISTNLLDIRLPVPGPNCTLNAHGEVLPLLATITNNLSLATELYVQVAGSKPAWAKLKRDDANRKAEAENALGVITTHLDMLYRAIQTLDGQRESARSMLSSANNIGRMFQTNQMP